MRSASRCLAPMWAKPNLHKVLVRDLAHSTTFGRLGAPEVDVVPEDASSIRAKELREWTGGTDH